MICPKCKKNNNQNSEMRPNCGAPIISIPVPACGKIKFYKYDWFVRQGTSKTKNGYDKIKMTNNDIVFRRYKSEY